MTRAHRRHARALHIPVSFLIISQIARDISIVSKHRRCICIGYLAYVSYHFEIRYYYIPAIYRRMVSIRVREGIGGAFETRLINLLTVCLRAIISEFPLCSRAIPADFIDSTGFYKSIESGIYIRGAGNCSGESVSSDLLNLRTKLNLRAPYTCL